MGCCLPANGFPRLGRKDWLAQQGAIGEALNWVAGMNLPGVKVLPRAFWEVLGLKSGCSIMRLWLFSRTLRLFLTTRVLSTRCWKSVKSLDDSYKQIPSRSPYMKSSYFSSSSSISIGAYRDSLLNFVRYSCTYMFPCLSSRNSFFNLINSVGMKNSWNASVNSTHVTMSPSS